MNGAAHAGHPEDVDEATKATSSPSSAERDARSGAGTQSGLRYSDAVSCASCRRSPHTVRHPSSVRDLSCGSLSGNHAVKFHFQATPCVVRTGSCDLKIRVLSRCRPGRHPGDTFLRRASCCPSRGDQGALAPDKKTLKRICHSGTGDQH